jgi:hypothetical protein
MTQARPDNDRTGKYCYRYFKWVCSHSTTKTLQLEQVHLIQWQQDFSVRSFLYRVLKCESALIVKKPTKFEDMTLFM